MARAATAAAGAANLDRAIHLDQANAPATRREAARDTSSHDAPASLHSFESSFPSSSSTATSFSTSATSTSTLAPLPPPQPPSDNLEEEASLLLERRDHVEMGTLVARVANGPMTLKKMDEEAIAGTVVGVVLGVALLVCCLYPVVVNLLKKRRRKRMSFDEYEGYRGMPPISLRRLSGDSYKHPHGGPSKDPNRNSQDPYVSPYGSPRGPAPTPGYVDATLDQNLAIDSIGDAYYYSDRPTSRGETFPAGTLAPHQIVLKGTSEDYYSPHIPSEAFGMFPTPEADSGVPRPERASRGGSLRYNVKQLFRSRKNTHDDSSGSYATPAQSWDQTDHAPPGPQGAMPMQQLFTQEETTESPVDMSSDHHELPSATRARGSHAGLTPESTRGEPRGSESPYSERLFSHPRQAAPGTVNPMDIMPASTESEMWHRTDYQLHTTSSYDSQPPPRKPSSNEDTQMRNAQGNPSPSQQFQLPPPPPPPASAPPAPPSQVKPPTQAGPSSQVDAPSQPPPRISAVPLPRRPSNAVNQSELSTPVQGTASATTQSTPSTQVDSPSPESLNSSDYCQSTSPHAMGIPSPKGGVYACDEPGCNQVFDQPHKLKHHQRYHSKDHKCPYPTCGKGFGTKTHLQRHINDRHEKKKKFHCSIQGCDYSRAGGKAFPRKDNWKRHMTKIHGMDHRRLPEPVEVDQEMTGV